MINVMCESVFVCLCLMHESWGEGHRLERRVREIEREEKIQRERGREKES